MIILVTFIICYYQHRDQLLWQFQGLFKINMCSTTYPFNSATAQTATIVWQRLVW